MLEPILAVIGGLVFLVLGADRFVLGASATARNLGVAPIIIGLTVVGFGTSAPEMLVSGVASWQDNTGLAIGNAIGSNIANIGLVLGLTALLFPLNVRSETMRRELPIMLVVMFLALMLLIDGDLNRGDGVLLIFGMGLLIYWVTFLGIRSRSSDPIRAEFDVGIERHMPMAKALMWLLVGIVIMFVSSKFLVWGAIIIAKNFGISDLVIGLTIVAIGTSLPELAAAIMSAIKKEYDIAIGNVIGSNMFNLLGVMAIPGLIAPGNVPSESLSRDYPVMIGLSIAFFLMAYGFRGPGRINRIEGGVLLSVYFGYLYYLYQTSI